MVRLGAASADEAGPAASGGGASWAGGSGGSDAATVVAEREGNNADAVINEGHNDCARNTTTLQMLKTRDLVVYLLRDYALLRRPARFR